MPTMSAAHRPVLLLQAVEFQARAVNGMQAQSQVLPEIAVAGQSPAETDTGHLHRAAHGSQHCLCCNRC